MSLFRKSVSTQVSIRLVNGVGAPVTGVLPSDIQGGICTVVKADGTQLDVTLTTGGGGNFQEFSPASKTRGLYHVTLPSGAFSVVGPVQWVVLPAASVFASAGFVGEGVVEDLPSYLFSYLINSDGASPIHSAAAALRLVTQFFTGKVKQDTSINKMIIYKEDNTTALSSRDTFDAAGAAASDPIYKVSP